MSTVVKLMHFNLLKLAFWRKAKFGFLMRKMLLICILFSALLSQTVETKRLYFHGYTVYRIFINSSSDFTFFHRLIAEYPGLDMWHIVSKYPYSMDVSVAPGMAIFFNSVVDNKHLRKSVLINDLSKFINYPEKSYRKLNNSIRFDGHPRLSRGRRVAPNLFSLQKYNTLQQIDTWLNEIQTANNDIVEIERIGYSYEKKSILKLKIGKKARNHIKPSVWIDAGIHSREWLSISTALYIINELITKYKSNDSEIVELLTRVDFHIAPVINPDGYQFSHETNRLWRKTLSKHDIVGKGNKKMCMGVDANRNFDYFWGAISEAPDDSACSDGYPGPKPMSESETVAVAKSLKSLRPQLMAYITLHSYGQMWLAPWGHSTTKPESYQRQRDMAVLAIGALQSVHGTPYSFGTVSDLLYPAAGTSVDYAHSLNVTYSYAVELRPDESASAQEPFRGFLTLEDQIEPTGRETYAALISMVREILNE